MSYLTEDSFVLSFSYYEFILFLLIIIAIIVIVVAVYAIIDNVISTWNACASYKCTVFIAFIVYLWQA